MNAKIQKILKKIKTHSLFLIRGYVFYTIKFDLLLVYTFSKTPFFFVWLIINLLGFFADSLTNLVNLYCLFASIYILGTAIFIFIVLSLKKTRRITEELVGVHFLERFAPQKGFSNLLNLLIPIITLLIIEVASIHFRVKLQLQEANYYSLLADESLYLNQLVKAEEYYDKKTQIYANIVHIKGVATQLTKHPYILSIHSMLSKVLGV